MEQYISKAALLAEIEKEIKRIYAGREYVGIPSNEENIVRGLQKAEDIIDTLEVKEIGVDFGDPKGDKSANCIIDTKTLEVKEEDFETELDEWMKTGPHTSYPWCTIPDAIKITAEHFFELGLRYNSSYISIPNIDDTLKEMGVDPDSNEARNFKGSYYRVLDELKEQSKNI